MSISRSTTSQRCFTALEWSPQSPDLNPVNLSCSRNQFWVLLHGTLSCCKHPYADGSIHADRPSPTPPSLPVCTTNMRQDGSMLSWCFCHILTLPAECHCRNEDKTLAQLTKHKHCTLHSIHSLCSEECLDRYTDLLHICIAQHRRTTSVGRDSAGKRGRTCLVMLMFPFWSKKTEETFSLSINRLTETVPYSIRNQPPTMQFWSLFASRFNPRSHNEERDGAKSHEQLTTWWKWPLTTCFINSGPIIPRIMSKGRIPLEIEYQGFSTSCFWTEKGSWIRGPVSFSSSVKNWPR